MSDAAKEVVWRDLTAVSDRLATILEQMTRVDYIARYDCTTAVLADLETLLIDEDFDRRANLESWSIGSAVR